MKHPREPDLMLTPVGWNKGVGRDDRPMSWLFGLIGLFMHWLQRKAGLPGSGTPTFGKGIR